MRHINGVYTQRFNRKHGVDGPLFFVDWIKGGYYDLKTDDEVPQAKTLAPAPGMIIDEVCAFYDVQPDDLNKTQRGRFNEPRNAAVYLMRKIRRDRLKEIGERFGIGKQSTVSSIIEGTKQRTKTDRRFRKRIDDLRHLIINSQKQT